MYKLNYSQVTLEKIVFYTEKTLKFSVNHVVGMVMEYIFP